MYLVSDRLMASKRRGEKREQKRDRRRSLIAFRRWLGSSRMRREKGSLKRYS
jgi:hypothetical protein